jgi:hypothetical protein
MVTYRNGRVVDLEQGGGSFLRAENFTASSQVVTLLEHKQIKRSTMN